MKVGASYYPELIDASEWERDLTAGREVGLQSLRCGEFSWSTIAPEPDSWNLAWAVNFLDLAVKLGYDVIWCTPSATPPPYLFDRWPELQAVNIEGRPVPRGVRRNYCPSHPGYRDLCAETAERLAQELGGRVIGWQVDNEIAGDGFTCWCSQCGRAFQSWLAARYDDIATLNAAWQTDVWSQRYIDWDQIPVPQAPWAHAPAAKLEYRRFRSDNWKAFYLRQYQALHRAGAERVTTNFYNLTWDVPFDQWDWRPSLDAVGISHYLEDETASHFQLALLGGGSPEDLPLWVLEQKAGQQAAQNLYPDDMLRIERHLRICAEHGAEYAIYWHLRQHSAGCEMEHGAVLRHDGKPGRIAQLIQQAVLVTEDITERVAAPENLVVFSFQQQWANETRPAAGARWDYREQIEQHWYGAARDVFGDVRVGSWRDLRTSHQIVIAPFMQLEEPGVLDRFWASLDAGATLITTVDLNRLDTYNNVRRVAPLACLSPRIQAPSLEIIHLKEGFAVNGQIGIQAVQGRHFWAVPDEPLETGRVGWLGADDMAGPAALRFRVGPGCLIVALSALDRVGVAALLTVALLDR